MSYWDILKLAASTDLTDCLSGWCNLLIITKLVIHSPSAVVIYSLFRFLKTVPI